MNTNELENMLQEMVNKMAEKIAAENPEMAKSDPKEIGRLARETVLQMANIAADIAAAEVMGQRAFVNGKTSAPAADGEVMKLVAKYSTTDFSKSHVINAIFDRWAKGWHTANLVGDLQ
jgi:hypothetical protein